MHNEQLLPARNLVSSVRQLWKHSVTWKLALLGATVCTGLYLLHPPWEEGHQVDVVHHVGPPSAARPAATTIRPQQNGQIAKQMAVAQPVAPMVRTAVEQPRAVAQMVAPPAPVAQHAMLSGQPGMLAVADPAQQPASGDAVPAGQIPSRGDYSSVGEGLGSQVATADEHCGAGEPMHVALTPPPAIAGRIEGFLPDTQAMALIPRSEEAANGRIDPAYVHNLRALFHPDDAPPNVRVPVLVPDGMDIHIGERVRMVGGHASPGLACHYIPNLIVGVSTSP